jgi:hypothetical protein
MCACHAQVLITCLALVIVPNTFVPLVHVTLPVACLGLLFLLSVMYHPQHLMPYAWRQWAHFTLCVHMLPFLFIYLFI